MKKTFYDWQECRNQDIVEAFNMLGGQWTHLYKGADGRPKRGRKLRPLCLNPGHDDHCGGNFDLNREKGVFYCRACGEGGSIIDLVMLAKSCDFQEAVKWIGDHFKLKSSFEPKPPKYEEHEHLLSPYDGVLIGLCKSAKGEPTFPLAAPESEIIWLPEKFVEEGDDPFVIIKNPRWCPLRSLYYSDDPDDREYYYFIVAKKAFMAMNRLERDWDHLSPTLRSIDARGHADHSWFSIWLDVFIAQYSRAKAVFDQAMKWYRRYYLRESLQKAV